MAHVDTHTRTFIANVALTKGQLVKLHATLENEVIVNIAATVPIGQATKSVEAGDPVGVKLLSANGTCEGIAAATFVANAVLYAAAAGEIDDSGTVTVGYALEPGAAGEIVEFLPNQGAV